MRAGGAFVTGGIGPGGGGTGAPTTGAGGGMSIGPSLGIMFDTMPQLPVGHGAAQPVGQQLSQQSMHGVPRLQRPNQLPPPPPPIDVQPVAVIRHVARVSETRRLTISINLPSLSQRSPKRRVQARAVPEHRVASGKASPCASIMRQDETLSKPWENKTKGFFARR
jgi:hypothetical protein